MTIEIHKRFINNLNNCNDEDYKDSPNLYNVDIEEKNIIIKLSVAWFNAADEFNLKIVSFNGVILNCQNKIDVDYDKTGKMIQTDSIKNYLVDFINQCDIKCLSMFDKELKKYEIAINKIDRSSFGLLYITDFIIKKESDILKEIKKEFIKQLPKIING